MSYLGYFFSCLFAQFFSIYSLVNILTIVYLTQNNIFKYSSAIKLNGIWTKQLGPRDSLPLLGIPIDGLQKRTNKVGSR